MTKETLKKELEGLHLYCKNSKIIKKASLSKYAIEKLIETFELIGIEKIYIIHHFQEFKINKKDYDLYKNNQKVKDFKNSDSICGEFEISFFIKDKDNISKCFKIKDIFVLKF